MLGAVDPKYYILLTISAFLEENISFGGGHLGEYIFGALDQDHTSMNSNLGTHLFNKFGTTQHCRCDAQKMMLMFALDGRGRSSNKT
eukprot:4549570-Ditylum_brightwellii.AAC.1